jgi:uncharacterized protein
MATHRAIGLALTLADAVALGAGPTTASHLAESPKKHRIVYHLSEPGADKARFVLGNIQNHIAGVEGWDHIEAIELVVHGPALEGFTAAKIDPDVKRRLTEIQREGVVFGACGNTMASFNPKLEQLPAGARPLPQGGVVRIMELVEQGYVYIRP